MAFKIKTIIEPKVNTFGELSKRPSFDPLELFPLVKEIFDDIAINNVSALKKYTQKFDGVEIDNFEVRPEEFEEAQKQVDKKLKGAIKQAYKNIHKFHSAYNTKEKGKIVETMQGVKCRADFFPIDKVGLYIPGGTAPLFSSVLMLAIPAKIAGCKEVVLCTPPNKEGKIHPAILFAAQLCGVNFVFKLGGIQAIAAMTLGAGSVPSVYKIFGPGNAYVNAAKTFAQLKGVAIDLPAGPSEVAVYAGKGANPMFAAADLISQAEHGNDSQVVLVTKSEDFVKKTEESIEQLLANNPRSHFALKSLENSRALVIKDETKAFEFLNYYAPEHLIILDDDADKFAKLVRNAGSVFVGHYTPESAGDYASGTNHTLPTAGAALAYSGVSVGSFLKRITFQKINKQGIQNIAPVVIPMAYAEELHGHAQAIEVRINTLSV